MSISVATIVKLAGAGLVGLAAVSAQPGGSQPTDSERAGRRVEQPVDRATLRARLERRLEDSRKNVASLEEGLKKLDSGADPMEVSRAFERGGRSGRGGEGRGGEGWRGGGRPDGAGPPADNSPISSAERESLMAVVRETMPTVAERLDALAKSDPKSSERIMGRLLPKLREAVSVRERDPELFGMKMTELKTSSDLMAAAHALNESKGDAAEKETLRAALREAVSKHFDARQASQDREIRQLEERLAGLRAEASRKAAERDAMIESFVKKIEDSARPDGDRGERRAPK